MKTAFLLCVLPILVAAQFPANLLRADCHDACESGATQCSGMSLCECQNHGAVSCWLSRQGRCTLNVDICPVPKGGTAASTEYPPCGKGLPACATNKSCHKSNERCVDFNSASCIGICIPNLPPPPPKAAPAPAKGQPKGPAPAQQPKGPAPAQQPKGPAPAQQPKGPAPPQQPKGQGPPPAKAPPAPPASPAPQAAPAQAAPPSML